jgi:dsDNA-specific endonuclease/ATPase MutS2
MILSKLHEEMQPRLREIRMKLNTLNIERQPPKSKNKGGRKCAKEDSIDHDALPRSVVGGKAGRSNFVVQVGEVQNLYKTTKSSALASSHQSQSSVPTLDLHGCTREEAIARLNESLEEWVVTAMEGSYPFVITAVIVCGCGSQVLSETVQEWIKSTSQVRNAPKNHLN